MPEFYQYITLVISCIGFVLNSFAIIMLLRSRKFKQPFLMNVLSLCFADLFVFFTCAIFHSLNFAYGTNKTVGEVYTYAVTVSLLSSQSHLMSIAVQRLIAVKYPLQCKRYLTQRRCIMVLAFIWLLSLNLPWVLRLINHAKISFSSSFICAPTLVLSYAYISFRMVRRKNIAATSSNSGGTVIWFSLAITLTFLICKLPAVVLYLTMNFSTEFFAVFCLY